MWTNRTRGFGKTGSPLPALILLAALALFTALTAKPAHATLSIDTSSPTDWVITNGTLKLDWDSTTGRVSGAYLNGVNLVDTTNRSAGLYMDNTGSMGGGAATTGFHQGGSSYIDWWITFPASASNAFTFSEHFILNDGATGFSVYCVADHAAASPTGGLGQIQYVFRINNTIFNNAYYYDLGLGILGETIVPLPNEPAAAASDPGRNVQNAVLDLHGISQPAGWTRLFDTKYDRCTYQYLHQADGAYGSAYGVWTVLPSKESLCGGPTHQSLDSEGLLIMECLSGHIDNPLNYTVANGVNESHLWGPFYFHFNKVSSTLNTPNKMYQDALAAGATAKAAYDNDGILTGYNGYIAQSRRGNIRPTITGGGSSKANTAWVVLSDNNVNTQLSCHGMQYWTANNSSGNAEIDNVVPGSYRLSAYVLGDWGELRSDNTSVTAGATATPSLTFVPENFSSSAPIWTIGTPDRSAHEFLHGHDASGKDDREYQGAFNFWADFASTNGAVVYNATNGPGYTATNNLNKWNYIQWINFDPNLFGGFYNSSDDTTDGYKYIVPSYVGDPATATCPPWTVHFTATSAQMAQGQYAVLSVAVASTEGDVIANLNGHTLVWRCPNTSDADVRSGLSGYTEWAALQFDAADLKPAGQDNVLILSTTRRSVMYDALRFEITNTSADPATRGWHDYEYLYNNTDTLADDTLDNP